MAFFRSLQESAFTDWFLGSDSIWTYPTVLTLHTVGMAMLVGASFVINLRILQVAAGIPLHRLQPLYRFVWIGFAINLLTGLVLFVTQAADRVVDPVFYVKMGSIAVALWLGGVAEASHHRPDGRAAAPDRSEPLAGRGVARLVDRCNRRRPSHGLFALLPQRLIMHDFSVWLESTRVSKALFDITWLWPICESLHFIGLCMLIGGAGLLDLRLMGLFRGLRFQDVKELMPWAIGGFAINAVTGTLFLVMQPHLYLTSAVWWSKFAFLAIAGLNAGYFETRLAGPALAMAPDADTPRELKIVGALSLFSWFAVLYCGRMLPYLGTGN